jgi:hypothetical protein
MGDHARAEAIDSAVEPTIDRLHEEILLLRERNREYALLFPVLGVLHSTSELEAVLRIVLTAVTAGSALGFNGALVFLVDPDGERLRGRAGLGPATGEEAARIWGTVSAEDSFSELAASAARARPGSSPLDRVAREDPAARQADSVSLRRCARVRRSGVQRPAGGRLPAGVPGRVETGGRCPRSSRAIGCSASSSPTTTTGRKIRDEVELLEPRRPCRARDREGPDDRPS